MPPLWALVRGEGRVCRLRSPDLVLTCSPILGGPWPPKIGAGGIRTLGTVTRTPHFQCGPFSRSDTAPCGHAGPEHRFDQGRRPTSAILPVTRPPSRKERPACNPPFRRLLPPFGAPFATEISGSVPATGCRRRCRTDQSDGRHPPTQGRRPSFGVVTTITCIKAWLGTAHAGRSAEFLGPHGKEVVRVWPISTN